MVESEDDREAQPKQAQGTAGNPNEKRGLHPIDGEG